MNYKVFKISTDVADAWIIGAEGDYDYAYGGTRMAPSSDTDNQVKDDLFRLMAYESHLKNSLINKAVENGAIGDLEGKMPEGFMDAKVGGGRCVFRAKNKSLDKTFSNPNNRGFAKKIRVLFNDIGEFLNTKKGKIKLTPDFGKFADVSDVLHEFTPNVLGIKCENGGCGGKSSYASTGILAALKHLGIENYMDTPVMLIGSDGALGSDVSRHFFKEGYKDIKVCDLEYDTANIRHLEVQYPDGKRKVEVLPSTWGKFTNPCLERGGVIVATTAGKELENSDLDSIPDNTLLILAHNLALPISEKGRELAKKLEARNIKVLPGQLLTLGGALTSRLEWFFRENHLEKEFDKPLAHQVVERVITFLVKQVENVDGDGTFYEKMCNYAEFDVNLTS